MNHQKMLRWGVWAPLSLAVSLPVSPAWAQVKQLQEIQDPAPEAELPDIEAIEKGQRPPASVSFRRPGAAPGAAEEQQAHGTRATVNVSAKVDSDAATRNIEGAAEGLSPPGGVFGVEGMGDQGGEAGEHAGAIPELHVVKKGDTLWSLCDFYFRDPWRWPRLWAQNPLITNPHWIFPGDVVRLREPGSSDKAPVATASGSGGPSITSNRTGSLASKALVLRSMGYVEAGDLAAAAVVHGSREEKIMLATGDSAYMSYSSKRPLRAGERYTVFVADTEHPVRSPETGAVVGYLVRIYGDIVVDQISQNNAARGVLVDLVDPVERGALVSPMVRQFRRIEPKASDVNVEARVVASFAPVRMLAGEHFVVLSRGKKDGVQVGNRTFVIRRGDGYKRMLEAWETMDPSYPKEVVGELLVVDVRDNTSVAWIARSSKELRVGEITEMKKGY